MSKQHLRPSIPIGAQPSVSKSLERKARASGSEAQQRSLTVASSVSDAEWDDTGLYSHASSKHNRQTRSGRAWDRNMRCEEQGPHTTLPHRRLRNAQGNQEISYAAEVNERKADNELSLWSGDTHQ